MELDHWYFVVGGLLLLMVFISRLLARLPITSAMLYMGLGGVFASFGWIALDSLSSVELLHRFSEIAVIISLFSAGLKLRLPLRSIRWRLPFTLAFLSMTLSVGMITVLGVYWLELPLGAAVILGAALAPTDPVLASDVHVENVRDTNPVRFTLTGEAGLNDGAAFPFIMLGMGLLGLNDLGTGFWRWWAIDVAWAIGGGILCGVLLGTAISRFIIYLRREHREALGLDDFLAIGLIATTYGLALIIETYGFLAVFAAGLSLRSIERELSHTEPTEGAFDATMSGEESASDSKEAPRYMAEAALHFSEHLERIAELTLMLLVGSLLMSLPLSGPSLAVGLILMGVIRPLAVAPLAWAFGMNHMQTALVAWFGIRGIGSIYYLFFAISSGLAEDLAKPLIEITIWTIALSVFLHGMTATPMMRLYRWHRRHSKS